jgi:hypothetical protein
MAISTFLPLVEPINAFRRVEDNTLIQHDGWMLIALTLGIAASGYRVSRGGSTVRWVPIVLCVLAAGLIVFYANDKDLRTLYPVGPNGNPITTQPGMVANLGIAIYVAGAGVAAALIGSVILGQSARQRVPDVPAAPALTEAAPKPTKKCPDCAETVLADARVCKHCGYRFAPVASSEPATKPPGPTQPASNEVPDDSRGKAPIPIASPSTSDLQAGHRVQVVFPGDDYDGKVGTVKRTLDDGEVDVKFGPFSGTYRFGRDELKPIRTGPEQRT